jgi:hypothetical protein
MGGGAPDRLHGRTDFGWHLSNLRFFSQYATSVAHPKTPRNPTDLDFKMLLRGDQDPTSRTSDGKGEFWTISILDRQCSAHRSQEDGSNSIRQGTK